MPLQQSIKSKEWRDRALSDGRCPRCGIIKTLAADFEKRDCFNCRRIKSDYMRMRYRPNARTSKTL